MSYPGTLNKFQFADSPSIDAFDRARVSNPTTLFDSKQLYDAAPLFWDEVDSGGSETSSHSTTDASTTIGVTANTEYVIRQTKMRMNYQPGKSLQILTTFVLGSATTNVEKRVGYFNTSTSAPYTANIDGLYLYQDGTTQYLVQAKNGTPTSVAQSSWNVDPLDGSGPSGITLDWTKAQIMIIDLEWLGVGRVRMGFVIDGLLFYAHEFLNANNVSSVYMSSPNHSVRYEIRSSGGADSLVHICSSVNVEGGENALGVLNYASTAGTHVDADVENTLYAVVGIRLKTTHLDAVIRIVSTALQVHTDTDFLEWVLIFNPTVAGTFTYTSVSATSALERALGALANTVTGGTTITGGYIESGGTSGKGVVGGSIRSEVSNALRLGAALDGTRDTIVLAVRPIGGSVSVDVEGSITWRELV